MLKETVNEYNLAALIGHYRNGATLKQMAEASGLPADFIQVYITNYLGDINEVPDKRITQKQTV